MPQSLRAFDPLLRPSGSKAAQLLRSVLIVLAALGLHAFMLTAIFAANRVATSVEPPAKNEKIKVAIVEPPPPPPPVEPPPAPEPEPERAPPPPKKKPKPKPKPKPKKLPPPPDPIDLPPDPPKTPPKKQPRRIVGLNLESTVKGAGGPSFAVGNTRMGQTGDVAEDAKKVRKLDKTLPGPPPNRKATRIPGSGRGKVASPSPIGGRIRPEYPKLLRAQNVEGNVTVEVRIDANGQVKSVRIVEGARFKEFEASALAAAKKQKWKPATQGGRRIPYTLTYTYRFRITD